MAEESTSRNQQFLQKFERQRLKKTCNRIIDLRGKVAGECQAYTFGGKTHYLDDRAYLLAKQLLDYFNGQYTFGVYEGVLKTLKSLSAAEKADKSQALVRGKKSDIEQLSFDRDLQRKEPRIIYATPVEIRLADVLYHGTTINITSSAIQVSLKRCYTLDKGDELSITFPELAINEKAALVEKIPYTIFKIDHDELRTQLILVRNRHDNDELTQWLDGWSQDHNSGEHLDLDNELSNLTTHYYLRLYYHTLHSALFWLNHLDNQNPIKSFQMNQVAGTALQHDGGLDLSFLPFDQIISEKCDFLLLRLMQEDSSKHYLVRREDQQQLAKLLNWHSQQTSSQLFLIQTKDSSVIADNFEQEITHVSHVDPESAQLLTQRLNAISHIACVTNISSSCQHLAQATHLDEPASSNEHWQGIIPEPTEFRHHIQRDKQRFVIRTNIQLHSPQINGPLTLITSDVSDSGLSISLPDDHDLKIGSRVTIDFVRWQTQTNKVDLTQLPYFVRNKKYSSGNAYYGLERDVYSSNMSINRFFTTTIDNNKEQLVENNADVLISQETKILSSTLAQQLTTTSFYLAIEDDKYRHIQAVSTPKSDSVQDAQLWQEMQKHVLAMSELLNEVSDKTGSSPSFGLYCYQDKQGIWRIQADYALSTPAQKSLFINQALHYEKHAFYHCTLSPIETDVIDQEGDLNQTLLQLRPHHPHKVKQIRETLHSIFAVGELIDITDIIKANYQSS